MKIRPLYDRVVVKRIGQQRTTASGIVIPDATAEKPEQGEVIAVGSGKLLQDGTQRPLQLKVGDQVLLANTRARPSRSTATSCSSCARKTSWESSSMSRRRRK